MKNTIVISLLLVLSLLFFFYYGSNPESSFENRILYSAMLTIVSLAGVFVFGKKGNRK